jgi:hypothetical protein
MGTQRRALSAVPAFCITRGTQSRKGGLMPPELSNAALLRKFRIVLGFFMIALVLSGLTAFPLERELAMACSARGLGQLHPSDVHNGLDSWLLTVRDGLGEMYAKHPWIAYGTDWLAFAHIVMAVFFIGAFVNPVRNVWVLQAGLLACALVVPLALICGPIRQIPLGWRLIDCSFGVFGAVPLWLCLRWARELERSGYDQRFGGSNRPAP